MNKNKIVEDFLIKKEHPLTAEIRRIREIILDADSKIQETIKWKSPTFTYDGNMASVNMNAKKLVSLMFHKGVLISDQSGLLEGDGKEVRTARFRNKEEIEKRKEDLQTVVREWIKVRDNQ